jgi:hypothetical protein
MPRPLSSLQRSFTALRLQINITASFNQLLRDGRIPILRRDADRGAPILLLEINVASAAP